MADPIPNVDRAPSTEAEIVAARIGPPTVAGLVVETIVSRARAARAEQ